MYPFPSGMLLFGALVRDVSTGIVPSGQRLGSVIVAPNGVMLTSMDKRAPDCLIGNNQSISYRNVPHPSLMSLPWIWTETSTLSFISPYLSRLKNGPDRRNPIRVSSGSAGAVYLQGPHYCTSSPCKSPRPTYVPGETPVLGRANPF